MVAFFGFLAFRLSVVPRFRAIAAEFVSLLIEAVSFLIIGSIVAAAVERYATPEAFAPLRRRLGAGRCVAGGPAV